MKWLFVLWLWGRLKTAHWVIISSRRHLWVYKSSGWKMVLKCLVTIEKTWYHYYSCLCKYRGLWVNRVSQRIFLKWPFVGDTREYCAFIFFSGIPGHRSHQASKIILERCSWNSNPLSRTLLGEIYWLLLWSPRTELFKLVELYFGGGLELAGHSVITLGETPLICWYISLSWSVCLCLQHYKVPLLWLATFWFHQKMIKKIIFHIVGEA